MQRLQSERDEIRAHLEETRVGMLGLQGEQAKLQVGLNDVLADRERIRIRSEQVQAELEHVYHSRSYRITTPLRAVFGAGRVWRSRLLQPKNQPIPPPAVNSVSNVASVEPNIPVYMQFGDQQVSLDEVMERIRAEVSRRNPQAQRQDGLERPLSVNHVGSFSRQETRVFQLIKRTQLALQKFPFYQSLNRVALKFKTYIPKYQPQGLSIDDLLMFDDEDFIRNAYRTILRREPDGVGFNHYLSKLRSGSLSKSAILGRLRYSSEGNRLGVKIKGLSVGHLLGSFFQR